MIESKTVRQSLEKAEQYIQDRRYEDAIAVLEKTHSSNGSDPKVMSELCATYMHIGKMSEAAKIARRWQKVEEKNPMVYTALGSLCLYKRGQWYGAGFQFDKALDYFNRAIELDAKNEMACQMAGLASFHHGALDMAVHYLRKASEINPVQDKHQYWLGRIAFRQGDLEQAIEHLKRTIRLNSSHPQAWRFLGWVYYERCNWEASIDAYQKAIQITPQDPTPYLRLGLIYGVHLLQFKKAVEHFKSVINRFPDWVPGYSGMADTYREHHKYVECIAWHIRALQTDPTAGYPLVQLYHLYRDLGDQDILKEIAKHGVNCKVRKEYDEMDFVDRARFFAMLNKAKTAHQLLDQYLKKFPEGRAVSVVKDYRALIDHPSALFEVDKSILKKIKSKLTPTEAKQRKAKKAKASDLPEEKVENAGGYFTHEYVLLRQFDWDPTKREQEDARQLWYDFYHNGR